MKQERKQAQDEIANRLERERLPVDYTGQLLMQISIHRGNVRRCEFLRTEGGR